MKSIPLIVVCFLGLFALPVYAAPKIVTMDLPDNPPPPFPTVLRKVVVFIQVACKASDGRLLTSSGTGFVVSYSPDKTADRTFDYLVTNKHVAECWTEDRHPQDIQSITIKTNLNDHTAKSQQTNGNLHWYFPNDDSVDLAATPWQVEASAELLRVPLDMLATRDFLTANYVGEGSKIIFSGFFYQLPDTKRLQPVVREGILSMLPDEPIQTTTGKPGNVYLGDIHSFGGNSGSPVFVDLAGIKPNGTIKMDQYRLLGVLSGYYFEGADFSLHVETTLNGKLAANSNVSIIVPAECVRDLLVDNAELRALRDKR